MFKVPKETLKYAYQRDYAVVKGKLFEGATRQL